MTARCYCDSQASSTKGRVHLNPWPSYKNKTSYTSAKWPQSLRHTVFDWSYRLVEEQAARWPHHPVRWRLTTVLGGSCHCVCWLGRWIASFHHSNIQNPEAEWTDLAELVYLCTNCGNFTISWRLDWKVVWGWPVLYSRFYHLKLVHQCNVTKPRDVMVSSFI